MRRPARNVALNRSGRSRFGFAWLELLLGIAAVALLFQFFPSLLSIADLRNWSQLTFFLVNIAVVLALVGVRFWPDWVEDWRTRQKRLVQEHAKAEKAKELKKQREVVERMKSAQKRRIY